MREVKVIQTNTIHQAAYVVDDLDAAIDRWMRVANIGPFYVMRDCMPENVIYRGQPTEGFLVDIGFCQAGPVQVELIQPKMSGPNVYRDSVPPGSDGYHHTAYFTDDLDAEFARFAAMGVEVATQATFGALRYAYFDTRDLVGCMTEVLEHDADLEGIFKMVADAAVDWDGSDPVRLIG
jgi:hypothetical protein